MVLGTKPETATNGPLAADHMVSARLLAEHKGDTPWLTEHLEGGLHSWLDGYTCSYCELPVRDDVDHRHPGYRIVEHTDRSDPESHLRVLHRFCNRMVKVHLVDQTMTYGLSLRRAWLGWATDQFLAGVSEKHFGAKHYERLGLHPDKLRNPALFKKYWVVRKMRCASHAIHYYAGKHLSTRLSSPQGGA